MQPSTSEATVQTDRRPLAQLGISILICKYYDSHPNPNPSETNHFTSAQSKHVKQFKIKTKPFPQLT